MLLHLILGLLRDGRPRHGYELISEYKGLSGNVANPGNFYRELGKLDDHGFIESGIAPPDEDHRRIPYRITVAGEKEFDKWLAAPSTPDEELGSWLLFADRLQIDVLHELLEHTRERLWLQGKTVERARLDALAAMRRNGRVQHYNPAATLLLWHLKRLTADLEFLEEFRRELDGLLLGPNRPKENGE